jgi:hypothetical protein
MDDPLIESSHELEFAFGAHEQHVVTHAAFQPKVRLFNAAAHLRLPELVYQQIPAAIPAMTIRTRHKIRSLSKSPARSTKKAGNKLTPIVLSPCWRGKKKIEAPAVLSLLSTT